MLSAHTNAPLCRASAFLPAAKLADWGLVTELVPDGGLAEAVETMVGTLAAKSPIGLRRMKRMIDDGLDQPVASALRYELAVNAEHMRSFDRNEGLAAFAAKRRPKFEGH